MTFLWNTLTCRLFCDIPDLTCWQHDPTCAILTQSEINLSEPPPVELIPRSSAETSIEILKAYFQQRRNQSALGICAELQRLVEQEQQHKADTLVSLFTTGGGGAVTRNL